MKKWLVAAVALLALGIPAAFAASPNDAGTPARAQGAADNAAKKCKAERESMGLTAFRAKYGTNANRMNAFGKCVSARSKDKADRDDDEAEGASEKAKGNAAKKCKAERTALGVGAFGKKYGTNGNLKNAFGKCVSSLSKAQSKND